MGRVGTCRLYSVYSVGSECGGWRRGCGGLGGWTGVGVLGGEWARENGVGRFKGVGLMS